MTAPTPLPARLVLVTGPSGAGRSTAINVLEDLGFEAIDNLPLGLVPRLLDGPPADRPMALGIDARTRGFAVDAFLDMIDDLAARADIDLTVLYLDCRAEVLLSRYSETRRRHPLAPAESPDRGVERELDLLGPIRNRSDMLLDTSDLTVHQLRAEIDRSFDARPGARLAVTLQSFSYKRGLPRGLDLVFDCRFLRNPYWQADLRAHDGRDPAVAAFVAGDPRHDGFLARVLDLTGFLLPAYAEEGKAHLTIGFGCTGGRHRSVALVERVSAALAKEGRAVSIRHRELERRGNRGDPA